MAHTVVLSDDKTVDPAHQREILADAGADVEILDETIASERERESTCRGRCKCDA